MIKSFDDIQNLFLTFRKNLLQQGYIEPKTPQEMAFLFDCFVNLVSSEKNEFDEKFKDELLETGRVEPRTTRDMAWVFGMIDIELRSALSHKDDDKCPVEEKKDTKLKISEELLQPLQPIFIDTGELQINKKKIDDYKYLKDLSERTQEFVITEIQKGSKNLYHSVMAVLMSKYLKGTMKDVNAELQSYIEKYEIDEEYFDTIKELFELCYKRVKQKPKKKVVKKK